MRKLILLLALLAGLSFGQTSGCPTGATVYAVPSAYATITLAEGALPGNLSGLGIQCIEVTAGTYNESVPIAGPTNPSATDRIYVVAAIGSEHKGVFTSGVIMTTAAGFYLISAQVNYCYIQDIVGVMNNAGQAAFNSFGRTNTTYKRVLAKTTTSTNNGFILNGDGEKAIACAAWNSAATSTGYGFAANTAGTVEFYNCIASNYKYSFFRTGGTVNARNAIGIKYAAGGGSDFTALTSQIKCASSDATASGTFPLINQSGGDFNFVDASTGDFHFASAAGNMYNSGSDQSGVFTVDVDLQTITTWMRGIDFFVAAPAIGSSSGCGRLCRILKIRNK